MDENITLLDMETAAEIQTKNFSVSILSCGQKMFPLLICQWRQNVSHSTMTSIFQGQSTALPRARSYYIISCRKPHIFRQIPMNMFWQPCSAKWKNGGK